MQPDYSSDRRKCPLHYEQLKYADIRDRRVVPYLLGGRQKPHCRNCNSNAPWARFCSWDFSKFSKWACLTFPCIGMGMWYCEYDKKQPTASAPGRRCRVGADQVEAMVTPLLSTAIIT